MIRLRLAETRQRRIAYALGAVAVVGLSVLAAMMLWPDRSDALRSDLEDEFAGAYPSEPAGGGGRVEIELVASETIISLVDGADTAVWAYNDTVPGPALRVSLGDTLSVTVRNDLDAATKIHWHGIRVPNDMDGVPDVNQPPIQPGDDIVYEYTPPHPTRAPTGTTHTPTAVNNSSVASTAASSSRTRPTARTTPTTRCGSSTTGSWTTPVRSTPTSTRPPTDRTTAGGAS